MLLSLVFIVTVYMAVDMKKKNYRNHRTEIVCISLSSKSRVQELDDL